MMFEKNKAEHKLIMKCLRIEETQECKSAKLKVTIKT